MCGVPNNFRESVNAVNAVVPADSLAFTTVGSDSSISLDSTVFFGESSFISPGAFLEDLN